MDNTLKMLTDTREEIRVIYENQLKELADKPKSDLNDSLIALVEHERDYMLQGLDDRIAILENM